MNSRARRPAAPGRGTPAGRDGAIDTVHFENAPPFGIERRLGLVKPGKLAVKRRAIIVAALAWAPLIVLAIVQSLVSREDHITPLVTEVAVHARYLIAAPLFVIAESVCAPRLNDIVQYFVDTVVCDSSRNRFDDAIRSTQRLLQHPAVETAIVMLVYLAVASVALSRSITPRPWTMSRTEPLTFTFAGWWNAAVSVPLVLILAMGWLWRLVLWARLLWLLSRLELRLLASHPDRCGGLSVLGHSLRAFAIVALALSAIPAGAAADLVLAEHRVPTSKLNFNIAFVATTAFMFAAPLLIFTPTLLRAWRRGTLEYGALAERVGGTFERKWLKTRDTRTSLEVADFSATTDLYSIVSNVYAMRVAPFDLKDIVYLVAAMLIPFIPVAFLTVPLNVIWTHVKDLIF